MGDRDALNNQPREPLARPSHTTASKARRYPLNTIIAVVAFLFMIASIYFNFVIVKQTSVIGRVTLNESGVVSMCINQAPNMTACTGFAPINVTYICTIDPQDRDSNGGHTYTANTTLFNITNLNASHGYILFTPSVSDTGLYTINLSVNDNAGCDNSIHSRLFNLLVADSHCIDGVQNSDEEGIDCGGSCPGFCTTFAPNGTAYITVYGNHSIFGNVSELANATVFIGSYFNYTNSSGGVRLTIPSYNYSMAVVAGGFVPSVTNISILANTSIYVNITLQPFLGTLGLNGTAYVFVFAASGAAIPNATVFIGSYYNYTNGSGGVRFTIPSSNYSISAVKDTYVPTVTNISILPNNVTFLNITLEATAEIPAPTTTPSTSAAASRAGGGGGFGVPIPREDIYFHVRPGLVRISVRQGETKGASFTVSNPMSRILNFSVSSNLKLPWVSIKPTAFQLNPRGTQDALVLASPTSADAPGVYFGKISITAISKFGEKSTTTIAVIIEVESAVQYFDVSLNIPGRYRVLAPGDNIKANIAVFSLGSNTEKEVELVFQIIGDDGHIWAESSSNLHLKDKAIFDKIMALPAEIPEGDYLYAAKVSYRESVGTSTELFTVKGKPKTVEEQPTTIEAQRIRDLMPLVWIILILLVIVMGIVVSYVRHRPLYMRRARDLADQGVQDDDAPVLLQKQTRPQKTPYQTPHPSLQATTSSESGTSETTGGRKNMDGLECISRELEALEQAAVQQREKDRENSFIHSQEVTKIDKGFRAFVPQTVQGTRQGSRDLDKHRGTRPALENEKEQLLASIRDELDTMEGMGIHVAKERRLLATLMKGGKSGKKRGRSGTRPSPTAKAKPRRKKKKL